MAARTPAGSAKRPVRLRGTENRHKEIRVIFQSHNSQISMRQCCSKMTSQKFSQNIFVPQGLLLSQAIEIANSTFSEICFANTLKLCEAAYVGFPSLSAVQA
jgi:hypothetical protein